MSKHLSLGEMKEAASKYRRLQLIKRHKLARSYLETRHTDEERFSQCLGLKFFQKLPRLTVRQQSCKTSTQATHISHNEVSV